MYKKLFTELEKRKITRNQLAKMTGIASQSLYPALAGKSQMFPGWRRRVSEVLGVSEEFLFSEEADRTEGK